MTSFYSIVHRVSLAALLLSSQWLFAADSVPAAMLADIVVYPKITAPATVISLEETDVSAQITAQVDTITADVGTAVQAGDLLLSLACDDYHLARDMAEAQLKSAQANLTLTKNRYQRMKQLLEQKLTSQEDLDSSLANQTAANADVSRAMAALTRAKLDVSRCGIHAPFEGVITQRYTSKGQLATSSSPLLRILNHKALEVSVKLSERDTNSFNQNTAFTFNGLQTYPVGLSRTVQALDGATRTQEIRLTFTAEQPLSGTAGKVSWRSSVPYIPAKYLQSRGGIAGLFTANDGSATFVPIGDFFPGKDFPTTLPMDTVIITGKLQLLRDGDSVTLDMAEFDTQLPSAE